MKKFSLIFLVFFLLFLSAISVDAQSGDTNPTTKNWTVCQNEKPGCDFHRIQDAVDGASAGDVIKIAKGVYQFDQDTHDQLVYIDKDLTLRGGYDHRFKEPPNPEKNQTILDAGGQGRVFYIRYANPTIEGLTITGGDATGLSGTPYGDSAGGGLYIYSGSITLKNNIIMDNYSPWDGGGVYLRNLKNATLIGNSFMNNRSRYGGGVYIWYSSVSIQDNTISNNTVTGTGGGIWMGVYSDATFFGNTISGNCAQEDYPPNGGGMRAERSKLHFENNIVQNNEVHSGGGGISIQRSSATLINNLFAENVVQAVGGGLYLNDSDVHLIHNTFARNTGTNGVGIYAFNNSNTTWMNNIIVGHTTGIFVTSGSRAQINGTLWGDGVWANSVDYGGEGIIELGEMNIWGDPIFVDPGIQNYHVKRKSPAVNSGFDAGVLTDIDGEPRPFFEQPDIGFDEWLPSRARQN